MKSYIMLIVNVTKYVPQKYQICRYQYVTMPACDTLTDRQTDGFTNYYS